LRPAVVKIIRLMMYEIRLMNKTGVDFLKMSEEVRMTEKRAIIWGV